jgi:hypothetical protein
MTPGPCLGGLFSQGRFVTLRVAKTTRISPGLGVLLEMTRSFIKRGGQTSHGHVFDSGAIAIMVRKG